MACKNCYYLHVPPDKSGHRKVRSKWAYECHCPIPQITMLLPDCITTYPYFQAVPPRRRMEGSDGGKCPKFRKRET